MIKILYRARLVWVVFLLLTSVTVNAQNEEPIPFKDRLLIDVISDYKKSGFSFFFSSDLVDRSLIFKQEPQPGPALDRLNWAIREFSLRLKPGVKPRQSLLVQSEEKYFWLFGRVLAFNSDYLISNARIEGDHGHVNSNASGEFSILVADSTANLYVQHKEYHPTIISIAALTRENEDLGLGHGLEFSSGFGLGAGSGNHLEISLKSNRLEEMIITASRYSLRDASQISIYDINAEELAAFPVLGQDVLRATSYLPGTSSNGLSAQPHIRGGLSDETLVLFNDIELLEPFHLKDFQSIFSGLNPSLIESVNIYTGGFPARYGNKMSGVIDITPVHDIPDNGGEMHFSFLSTGAALYGDLKDSKGHWIVSGRRGNLDLVVDYVDTVNGDPSYSDAYAQVVFELKSGATLDLGVLAYNDNVTLDALELITGEEGAAPNEQDGEFAHSRYRNAYAWVQLQNEDKQSFSSTTLSYGSIRHRRNGFIREFEEEDDGLNDEKSFRIINLSHKHRQSMFDILNIEYGGKLGYSKSEYSFDSLVERDELAEFLGVTESSEFTIQREFNGFLGGIYGSAQYPISKKISLELGLRWDFQDIDNRQYEDQFSPRFSARYDVNKTSRLRLSLGRFYQPEAINELQVSDGISQFQNSQYTNSVIVGFDQSFFDQRLRLRMETFYKEIKDPKFRFENIFNSLELLPELMDDRILIAPSEARSSGIELTLSYDASESLSSWLSFSRGKSEDKINGQWQARIWEQDKTLVGGVLWKPGAWKISSVVRWHSGWKTSEFPSGIDDLENNSINVNDQDLPEFFSLDLKLSREWVGKHHLASIFFEVSNLTNHKNIGGIEHELEENEDGSYSVISEYEELFPIIPSIGFELKFN